MLSTAKYYLKPCFAPIKSSFSGKHLVMVNLLNKSVVMPDDMLDFS